MSARYLQDYRFHSREAAREAMELASLNHPEDEVVLQDCDGLELERIPALDAKKAGN